MKRILCYGDSLTAGYSCYGSSFTPYGDTISLKLGAPVTSVGMSGWTSEEMIQGADTTCNEDVVGNTGDGLVVLLRSGAYDIVCLLAGTNDLGTGVDVEDTIENITILVNMSLTSSNQNLIVALLTVPPTGGEAHSEYVRSRRSAVNEGIKAIVGKNERVVLIDIGNSLTNPGVHPIEPTPTSMLWDGDLLHLSPAGSAKLGEIVFENLQALKLI